LQTFLDDIKAKNTAIRSAKQKQLELIEENKRLKQQPEQQRNQGAKPAENLCRSL